MILCTDCCEEINGKNAIQSTTIHGNCQVCGDRFGKLTIYLEKLRTRKVDTARTIMDNMKHWNKHLLSKDEEGEATFLFEVPEDKLKPEVKKVVHLRFGPKNVRCLYAIKTRRGIEFVHGFHHDEFCPAVRSTQLKRRIKK